MTVATSESALTLELSRRFDASPERVFDAWLESLGEWLAPPGARCEVLKLEPCVGGGFHVRMTMADGRVTNVTGDYREINRPRKLVFGWYGDYCGHESEVSVTFKRDGAGTVMTLFQEGFPDADLRDGFRNGWAGPDACFDKLAAFLARTPVA